MASESICVDKADVAAAGEVRPRPVKDPRKPGAAAIAPSLEMVSFEMGGWILRGEPGKIAPYRAFPKMLPNGITTGALR